MKAHYIIQDWYRDGIPIWWDESDRVAFEAVARVSKSRGAIERAQEKANKAKTPVHGRYFIAEPRVVGGGEFPTKQEWIEEQSIKQGKNKVSSKFESGSDRNKYMKGRK